MPIEFRVGHGPDQAASPAECEHLAARLLTTNLKISLYLMQITLAVAPLIFLIDLQRWKKGILDSPTLYVMLASLHVALTLSATLGPVLWFPN